MSSFVIVGGAGGSKTEIYTGYNQLFIEYLLPG